MFGWGGERVDIILSLSFTSMAVCGYITFAAPALSDDGSETTAVFEDRLLRSGCFS